MAPQLLLPPGPPRLPLVLQRRSNDEYTPQPHHPLNLPVVARIRAEGPDNAARLSMSLSDYWSSRQGTAAALRALDEAWGGGFYNVPPEAALDRDAADGRLGGDQLVIDVQTHFTADRAMFAEELPKAFFGMAETVSGDLFKGLDKLVTTQAQALYSLAEFLRCIYGESETDIAVLTSAPASQGNTKTNMLDNPEMFGTRQLIERLSGTGRLINHCVVTPNVPGDIEMMDVGAIGVGPAGWKVYTMFGQQAEGFMNWDAPPWMLDDERSGQPFLRRAQETGVRVVCAHKGLTFGPDTSWDGPSFAQGRRPGSQSLPRHQLPHLPLRLRSPAGRRGGRPLHRGDSPQGFQPPDHEPEGRRHRARLQRLRGDRVHLVPDHAHPREAAHVMGKLLAALGEDNIVWGTDCIWYGSPQPLLDAFRLLQIPEEYCQRYGYPQLTAQAKEKILGLNAARIYGIDPAQAKAAARNDDLAWLKAAIDEYKEKGLPIAS